MGKIQDGVKLVSGMGWGAEGEMKNEDAITVVGRDAGGALASSESCMAPNVAPTLDYFTPISDSVVPIYFYALLYRCHDR